MKKPSIPKLFKIGDRIAPSLTVLGVVDGGSDEPVYIVWHHDHWCPMACKMMRTWPRAEREAAVMAEMEHPFIVRVFGTVKPHFLLMPFIEGPMLADVIERQTKKMFPVSDALRVALHVGSALHHVHDRGYVHLDVKPDNIIVAPGGRPMLFDFGSARRLGALRPKHVIGTDAYIAPEECSLSQAGPPADVFALGVVLFEMLTRSRPFPKGRKTNPFPQVSSPPARLRAHRPGVPGALEDIVQACLEKEPHRRPKLTELMPALNVLITAGPHMWPDGFEP